ncbi:ABC transporter substrate-binding protein [Vibrio sp. S4M6]|uniref:substrate-binding periplasmic protein n=1 Tax=Vibrio sinus TaxID=2946865 RepID=UPI00202A46BC|nr:ABC transporter substrate-binding protein [Vibrio sinus]MCL9782070.1 ABC transporter substrate-binding protein [Vibrio sinus]
MRQLLVILTLIWTSSVVAQTKVTVYGDDSYPPYSYAENGKITGIYTVILKKVFSQMPDYDVSIQGVPWKRGLAQIKAGEIFALYPPYKRPKQRPYMQYDGPILDEKLVVVCQQSKLKTPRPNWPDDYIGLTIGNNSGFSAGGDKFHELVKAKKIKLDEVKGTERNLLKLISGRTDCYMNDALSIQWELKQLQKMGKYDGKSIKEGAVISSEQGYLGIITDGKKFPFKQDFTQQYLKVLNEMKSSGEIDKIIKDFVN